MSAEGRTSDRRPWRLPATALTVLALTLGAGCGSDDDEPDGGAAATTSPTAAEPSGDGGERIAPGASPAVAAERATAARQERRDQKRAGRRAERLYTAISADSPARICATLTPESRAALRRTEGKACPEYFRGYLKTVRRDGTQAMASSVTIGPVALEGDGKAVATMHFDGKRSSSVVLSKRNGEWLVVSFSMPSR